MDGPFIDLTLPSGNSLYRGMTTGSCATAAAKAALNLLLFSKKSNQEIIGLPSGEKLKVDINFSRETELGAMAQVTKNAGDDPDVTHQCNIEVEIKRNSAKEFRFFAGEGVGLVTEAGLQIPPGEPAINPVPRKMIIENLLSLLKEPSCPEEWVQSGLDVVISVPGGKEIAAKTFNPRLGVHGGISILGTTGIVEPMSISAWKSSIETYIDVALAANSEYIVFSPGRWGQNFFHKEKNVPLKRICIISNFVGFALNSLKQKIRQNPKNLKRLVLAGHPGKLAKVAAGHWNTHSSEAPSALPVILNIAKNFAGQDVLVDLETSRTVEHLIQLSKGQGIQENLFNAVSSEILKAVSNYLDHEVDVKILLADFKGNLIGQAPSDKE
jgi:cobalt-precorrin-5B (C1)-methyltransferase